MLDHKLIKAEKKARPHRKPSMDGRGLYMSLINVFRAFTTETI